MRVLLFQELRRDEVVSMINQIKALENHKQRGCE